MPLSEVEKIFQAFAEERKRALPQFTPDGIPITLENKFDDAIYNYLYAYWKEQSGEYDPKKDVIPESEMNKMHPKTKNEFQFENWLFEQYGMTKKEERGYTVKGNLESLWEIFSAADMVLFARGLPSIGKELTQLGKKAVDDVTEEVVEKTVKTEVTEEMAENTAKKEIADTAEDLSQKTVKKEEALEDGSIIKENLESGSTTFADMMSPKEATRYEAYWKQNAPNYNTPNSKITYYKEHNGVIEKSTVIYDDFGRQRWRIDYNNHGYSDHSIPHLHEREYSPRYDPMKGKETRYDIWN